MSDLTLCASVKCPKFGICYRGQALPSKWQSYTGYAFDENGCSYFWPIEKPGQTLEFFADEDDDEDDI